MFAQLRDEESLKSFFLFSVEIGFLPIRVRRPQIVELILQKQIEMKLLQKSIWLITILVTVSACNQRNSETSKLEKDVPNSAIENDGNKPKVPTEIMDDTTLMRLDRERIAVEMAGGKRTIPKEAQWGDTALTITQVITDDETPNSPMIINDQANWKGGHRLDSWYFNNSKQLFYSYHSFYTSEDSTDRHEKFYYKDGQPIAGFAQAAKLKDDTTQVIFKKFSPTQLMTHNYRNRLDKIREAVK